jgi:uncharacterized protein YsxB (DUF464 family)
MIEVDVIVDEAGLLVSCQVEGHAGAGPRGGDVVCAAISILVRTALRTLSAVEGVSVRGSAPSRGVLWMEADCVPNGAGFLAASTAFLTEGLRSVAEDYPDHCSVHISTERRQEYGSQEGRQRR